ncbi:MAG: DUF5677 domain-containing protein [Steroidobacter sp.]
MRPRNIVGVPALIAAHDRFLRDIAAFSNSAHLVPRGAGQHIAMALADRLLQLTRAAHMLAGTGYAAEARPLIRPMVSAAAALVYVCDRDSDGRSRALIVQGYDWLSRHLDDLERLKLITPEQATLYRARLNRNIAEVDSAQAAGLLPVRLGTDRHGRWHGFATDRAFFRAIDLEDWYVKYYAPNSEESHVTAVALLDSLKGVQKGFSLIGPRGDDPVETFEASYELNAQALSQLDLIFKLDRVRDIVELAQRMKTALQDYELANAPGSS